MTAESANCRPVPGPADTSSPVAQSEWRLPSGEDLISFALAAGMAASPLLGSEEKAIETAETVSGARATRTRGRTE
jgi:hypothetical protein